MKPVETALLFVAKPTWALENFSDNLNARLIHFGHKFRKTATFGENQSVYTAGGMQLIVSVKSSAMPADSFTGALESPLSNPFQGVLSDTILRHTSHIRMSVIADETIARPGDNLQVLQIAHAATTLMCEWHHPAAVYWQQSNQVLLGSQYLLLAKDEEPWALFAHAKVYPDTDSAKNTVVLQEASDLIGRPVRFLNSALPVDQMHAAALSFMRFMMMSGSMVRDGYTFALGSGIKVKVSLIAAGPDMRHGSYDLSIENEAALAPKPEPEFVDEDFRDLPSAFAQGRVIIMGDPNERVRSLAISYFMCLVMPPIGVLLLVLNTIFGPSSWRTGVIATASVALALVVSAYVFLGYIGKETAVFIDAAPVQTTVLPTKPMLE